MFHENIIHECGKAVPGTIPELFPTLRYFMGNDEEMPRTWDGNIMAGSLKCIHLPFPSQMVVNLFLLGDFMGKVWENIWRINWFRSGGFLSHL